MSSDTGSSNYTTKLRINSSRNINFTVADVFSFSPGNIVLAECAIGCAVNLLLLFVTIRDPLRVLRKRGWISITSLALADLLTCVGTIWLIHYSEDERAARVNFSLAKLSYAVLYVGYAASFFMLMLLSIEVYIATKYPLHARMIVTRRRSVLALLCSWLAAVVVGSCHFWTRGFPSVILILCISVFEVFVMIALVFRILVIVNIRRNRQNVAELTRASAAHAKNLTSTFLLLFMVYLVTAFPYFVGEQMHFLWHAKPEWNVPFDHDFIPIYLPIAYINFIANPFIYAWRIRDYRHSLMFLFSCDSRTQRGRLRPSTMGTGTITVDTTLTESSEIK